MAYFFKTWYSESRWYNFADTCDDLSISPIGRRGLNSQLQFNIIFGVYERRCFADVNTIICSKQAMRNNIKALIIT